MTEYIYIEFCEGGFIVETRRDGVTQNKRIHVESEEVLKDVRGRLLARCAREKETDQ